MRRAPFTAMFIFSAAIAAPAQQALAEGNLLLDQLHTLDFNTCRSAAETMADVLVDSENHGYSANWGPDTSGDMLVYTVENTWDDNSSNITVGAVAPTQAGDCDIIRTKVLVVRATCSSAASDWGLEREGALNSRWIKYTQEDADTKTYMQSVGNSCVVKQVEYVVGLEAD